MAKYISTGKFHFLRTIAGLVVGIILALLIGAAYAWATELIPFIIIEVIVFVGAIVLIAISSIFVVHIGLIRNKVVKAICVLITCLVAWYAQWVYLTQPTFWTSLLDFKSVFRDILYWSDVREIVISRGFSSGGPGISGIGIVILDTIELLCFLSPVYFATILSKDYFCESCQTFAPEKTTYVRNLDESKIPSAEMSGDFRFIGELQSSRKLDLPLGPIWEIKFAYCKKCHQFGVINIRNGNVGVDKKNKPEFRDGKILCADTLVSKGTIDELSLKLN